MRVPTQDNFSVMPDALPQARFNAPNVPDAGRQASAFGAAATGVGGQLSDFALQIAKEINETRTEDARNQLSAFADELRHDPEKGLFNQHGLRALQRDSGMALPDEYGKAFRDRFEEISAGLGNDEQRRMLQKSFLVMEADLRGAAMAHLSKQFKTYQAETNAATVQNRGNGIAANWSDDAALDENARGLHEAVLKSAVLNGWGEEKTLSELTAAGSRFFGQAVMGALDNNDTARAQALLERFRPAMDAETAARLDKALQNVVEMDAVDSARYDSKTDSYTISLPDGSRNRGIFRAESASHHSMNGEKGLNFDSMTTADVQQAQKKHEGAGGATGAAGLFQVMPATLKEAVRKGKIPADMRWTRDNQINVVGVYLLFDKRADSVGAYLSGKSGNRHAAQEGMAAEFAGFKRPSGAGAYDGVQGNRATVSADEVGAALDRAREAYRQALPRGREVAQAAAVQALMAGGTGQKMLRIDMSSQETMQKSLMQIKDQNLRRRVEADAADKRRAFAAEEKQRREELVGGIMQNIYANGGSLTSVPKSSLASLSSDEIFKVEKAAMEIRNFRRSEFKESFSAEYYRFKANPQELARFSEQQLYGLLADGWPPEWVDSLIMAQRAETKAQQDGVKSAASVSAGVAKGLIKELGLKEISKDSDAENDRKVSVLFSNLEQLNDDFFKQHKRRPSETELKLLAKPELYKLYTVKDLPMWFDKEEYGWTLTVAQRKQYERGGK